MKQAAPLLLGAAALVALLVACDLARGNWSPDAAVAYGLAIALWVGHLIARDRIGLTRSEPPLGAALGVALLAAIALLPGLSLLIAKAATEPLVRAQKALLLTAALWLIARVRVAWLRADALFALMLLLGLGLHLAMVGFVPRPNIDVWSSHEVSLAWLGQGINPYAHVIPDIYGGAGGQAYGYVLEGYAYPPANLLLMWPFHALGLDSRVAIAALEFTGILAAWQAIRKLPGRRRDVAETLLVAFYLQPMGPHVTEYAWTEPLVVGGAGWLFLFAGRRCAALIAGTIMALKQHLVFFGLFALPGPPGRPLLVRLAAAGGLALATIAPFLVADGPALAHSLSQQARIALYREDNLSLNGMLFHATDLRFHLPVAPISAASGLLAAIAALVLLRRGGIDAVTRHGFAFVATLYLGSFALAYAFMNHHYLVGALMALSLAADLRPSVQAARA